MASRRDWCTVPWTSRPRPLRPRRDEAYDWQARRLPPCLGRRGRLLPRTGHQRSDAQNSTGHRHHRHHLQGLRRRRQPVADLARPDGDYPGARGDWPLEVPEVAGSYTPAAEAPFLPGGRRAVRRPVRGRGDRGSPRSSHAHRRVQSALRRGRSAAARSVHWCATRCTVTPSRECDMVRVDAQTALLDYGAARSCDGRALGHGRRCRFASARAATLDGGLRVA